MAWSVAVQTSVLGSGASPTSTTAFSGAPALGHTVLIAVANTTHNTATVVTTNNASGPQPIRLGYRQNAGGYRVELWAVRGDGTATTYTATSSGDTLEILAIDCTGGLAQPSGMVDSNQSTGISSGSTGVTSSGGQPSVTNVNAGDLLVTVICLSGTGGTVATLTATGATLLKEVPASTSWCMAVAYSVLSSVAAQTPYFTWATSRNWVQMDSLLLPAGATPAGAGP